MKTTVPFIFLLISMNLCLSSCTQTTSETVTKTNSKAAAIVPQVLIPSEMDSITDERDGEIYQTVRIGNQIWFAENLRYKTANSLFNPDNPSIIYGRLYDRIEAQTICPKGWHLPTDAEWNELEMFLGMSIINTNKTFWRGEHGTTMKSKTDWADNGNGTNNSGFNSYPSGYYFEDKSKEVDMNIMGSAGYWSALDKDGKAWIRFFGAPKEGVNRFSDDGSIWKLACRCVQN
jgi:uncharacterized protein (TIGR02145 family)